MFNVKTEKFGEVRVSFKHCNPNRKPRGDEFLPFVLGEHGTYCFIATDGENEEIVGQARTFLSPLDQYDKDRGRKLSLARAMKDAGFNRDQRILFWRQYFATQGRSAWKQFFEADRDGKEKK